MDSFNANDSVYDSPFSVVFDDLAPTLNEKIVDQQQPGESWVDAVARLLPILAATNQQRELLQVQVDRARAGLPPLDVSNYGAGVQVGVSPDVKNLLMFGGVAALLVLAFGAHKLGSR